MIVIGGMACCQLMNAMNQKKDVLSVIKSQTMTLAAMAKAPISASITLVDLSQVHFQFLAKGILEVKDPNKEIFTAGLTLSFSLFIYIHTHTHTHNYAIEKK